jgi:hypothetical protein
MEEAVGGEYEYEVGAAEEEDSKGEVEVLGIAWGYLLVKLS